MIVIHTQGVDKKRLDEILKLMELKVVLPKRKRKKVK